MTATPSTRIRAAVIGTGNWGRVHIEAYWRNPETELVAVCGVRNRERAETMARQYGGRAYLDIAEMLEKERPDLVSIIPPDAEHYAPYRQVMEARVDCFLEKPLAMDMEQGRELVALARRQGIRCGINFNHRYATPFKLLDQHVGEGKIGRPLHLLWRFTGGHYPEGHVQPLAHLLYMQSHGFNMMQTFGGPIVSIAGHAFDPRGTGQLTSATFSLQFESGAVGAFVASVDGDYKDPAIYTFELMGDAGRAVVVDTIAGFAYYPRPQFTQTHQEQKAGESLAAVWNSHFFDDDSRQFARTTDRHIADFIRAMRADTPEPIPVEEGLAALEAGAAAIRAATEGRVIRLGAPSQVSATPRQYAG